MHSKVKGNIGEAAVAYHLLKEGYEVFTELGDNSRVDLIVLVDNKPIKIQVKALSINANGSVYLKTYKSGPGYEFTYTTNDVDIFAVYCLDTEDIGFIKAETLLKYKCGMKFRITESKNNQKQGIRYLSNYSNFKDIK